MPSVVQTQIVNSAGLMFKERSGEPIVSAFTAVNGRSSPPFPPKPNGVNGSSAESAHVRPYSHAPSEPIQDRKPALGQEWNPVSRPQDSVHYSVSPPLHSRDRSPNSSPPKRKRSGSDEDETYFQSPEGASGQGRRRFDPCSPSESSPDSFSHATMEQHQRTLPPINHHGEYEKAWPSHETQPSTSHQCHYHDPQDSKSVSAPHLNGVDRSQQHREERQSNLEMTRAGIPVDPKKRKRQFANRTKTGCQTCRKRKKKCDEAKPECNNCTRGGFPCMGYTSKPWPKIGLSKSHPPLQAKDQYALEPQQLFHSHGNSRESYPDAGSSDGARTGPIVVEEHERQEARKSWWNENPPPPHAPEHSRAPEYSHPPPTAHNRPPPNPPSEQYAQGTAHPGAPPQRQRIYNHTPQTMSHVVHASSDPPTEPQVHHVPPPLIHQGHLQSPSTGLPGPPPHYASVPPPRRIKSEKERMLSGEPFLPYDDTLLVEREHCSNAVFRFNMTSNERVQITREERHRHFQALVAAKWIPRTDIDGHHRGFAGHTTGYVGTQVFVDTPFKCDYGYNLVINDMVTIGSGCVFLDSGRISIGRNTRICANVTIDTQTVPTDSKSVKGSRGTVVAKEVSIGENVYIGANSTISAGIKIGTGAIIHPGSVVTKDIPRDCVARGNPANVISVPWED